MAYIPDLAGGDMSSFSPADFASAEETAPTGVLFDIGGNGQATPYSGAVNAILHKQFDEMKGKASAALNLSHTWKRRLRDFMGKKNNDLLDFLKLTVEHHPTFGPGEVLLRRFGNPQVTPIHPSVRDMIMDVSGGTAIDDINDSLTKIIGGKNALQDYAMQTQVIYDLYKDAGDDALRAQQQLKGKLEKLDRIQGKLSGLFDVEPNEKYEPLMKANEEYLQKIYDENQISEDYTALVAAYRRFVALRDVVTTARSLLAYESEPLCSICLDEPVAYAISPCGHTLCQTCVRRQSGQCFMCRTTIKDKLKLYFG